MEPSILLGLIVFALVWWLGSFLFSSKKAQENELPITLLITIEDSRSVAPPLPKGRVANTEKDREDSERQKPTEKADKALAGMAFFIVYQDAQGDFTERRITIKKITNKGNDLYISAFCHEREAARSFYSSRIESLTDLATGEVVDDATGYLQSLMAANGFGKPAQPSPTEEWIRNLRPIIEYDPLGKAMDEFQSEVLSLIFMARADGRMVKAERKVIFDFVKERLPEGKFFDEEVDDYLSRMYPDKDLFKEAFAEVMKLEKPRRERLIQALEAVMQADGKIKEGEASMLAAYRDVLSKAA